MASCDVYVDLARSFLAAANDLKAICLLRIEGIVFYQISCTALTIVLTCARHVGY